MPKVLVYGLTESFGGVEKIMFDLFSRLKGDFEVEFAFSCNKPDYFSKFESLGFKYRYIHKLSESIEYYSDIVKLCNEHKYHIAYCNLGFSNILLYLALKSGNVKNIIFHSHNTMIDINNKKKRYALKLFHFMSRPICSLFVNGKFACSELAYSWLFGRDNSEHEIIHNAVKIDEFIYKKDLSERYKIDLFGEKNIKIIGHVGRFSYQKNHKYLLNVFKDLVNFDSKYRLLLVGSGELLEEMKQYSIELGINKNVLFAGFQNDVKKFYQAMDCFVLPSKFEGLCIVGVEAQASGLPCFFSDTITHELAITDNARFLSIQKSSKEWAKNIHQKLLHYKRKDMTDNIRNAGYDIDYEAKRFIKLLEKFAGDV